MGIAQDWKSELAGSGFLAVLLIHFMALGKSLFVSPAAFDFFFSLAWKSGWYPHLGCRGEGA